MQTSTCSSCVPKGLNSGVEYAATRLLAPGANCGNLANLNVGGYAVTFNACARVQYVVNSATVNVYSDAHVIARGVRHSGIRRAHRDGKGQLPVGRAAA